MQFTYDLTLILQALTKYTTQKKSYFWSMIYGTKKAKKYRILNNFPNK